MAVYQFSALSDGQAIAFNQDIDRLNFDQTSVAAGDLTLVQEGSSLHVIVKSGTQAGKDVILTGMLLEQISPTNFTFADGSFARTGDNAVGTAADNGNNALAGGVGRDLLMGLGGNDTLAGGDNNDSLVGGAGNDALGGNNGNDWMEGNAGNDTLTGSGGQDAFLLRETGAANADLLADFASNWDNIQLDAAAFTQIGAAGRFAAGDARFFAGTAAHDADDRIIYNSATGQIFYDADGNGAGAAQLIATLPAGRGVVAADFNVFGTPGSGGGGNVINGTAGDDTLIGTSNDDTINGLGGNDSLVALEGADSLNGGDGNDTLDAWSFGSGDGVADTLSGGLGNDVYRVHDDGDVILADAGGIDTVQALNASWTLAADLENLDLEDSRGIAADGVGNALNNVIRSASEGGTLFGLGGNDLLIGRNAQNTVNLEGGDGNDTLQGGWHTDFDGGAGNDLLIASSTEDNMIGGTGADIFQFGAPDFDFIQDFASGVDKVSLDGTGFTQIGASGNFAAGDARFFAGADAHDADDRVIWDGSMLWYDPDGNGAAAKQSIAFLQAGATVVATDITVINGTAGGGGSTINGTGGNDTLIGSEGNDTINGLGGNDLLIGLGGSDSLNGGDGNDIMDAIAGTEAPDRSQSGEVNTLNGGLGDDVFIAWGSDVLQDAGGLDRVVVASPGFYQLPDGFENLRVAFRTEADEHFTLIGNDLGNVILPAGFRNTIEARGGDDRIYGNDDRDIIDGGDGNDWLHGGGGIHDELTGGAGADHFVIDTQPNDFDDTVFVDFTSGVDKIHLDLRVMPLLGATGNFAPGDPRFNAGPGFTSAQDSTDRVVYDTATGRLFDSGGTLIANLVGAPTLTATDIVVENGGIPGTVIYGTNQSFFSSGGSGIDENIRGTQYNDTMIGLAGNDAMDGRMGNDSMDGGAGNDTMVGREGNDTMLGGDGDDTFDLPWTFPSGGSSGTDSINGGAGIDVLRFGFADTATSGVTVNLGAGTFSGGSPGGSGTVANVENVEGTSFNDSLTGSAGANSLVGAGGNDTLNGGAGNDTLDGGFGTGGDTYAFASTGTANADLVVSFETGVDTVQLDGAVMTALGASGRFSAGDARFFMAPGASSGHDADDRVIFNQATFELFYDPDGNGSAVAQLLAQFTGNAPQATDIVVINGSSGGGGTGTTIIGTSGNDSLTGTTGNDTMNGGSGNDSLAGGAGNDSLTGSGGQDTFIFREFGAGNADRMTDFATNWDRLQVDNAAFTAAGAEGRLSSGDARFFAGTAAHDADDRFVFNAGTGQLYYDADGSGSGAAQLVATVQAGAGVAAADITVI